MKTYVEQIGEKVKAALASYPVTVEYGKSENGGFIEIVIPLVVWGETGIATMVEAAVMAGFAVASSFDYSPPKPRFALHQSAVMVWFDLN